MCVCVCVCTHIIHICTHVTCCVIYNYIIAICQVTKLVYVIYTIVRQKPSYVYRNHFS